MLEDRTQSNINSSFRMKSLWLVAITLFFAVSMNYDWRQSSILWYGVLLLLVVSYVIAFNGRFVIKNFAFFKWYLSFFALCCLSMLWCLSTNFALDVIKSLIINFIILLFLLFSLNGGFSVRTMLRCYFIATLVNAIYVITMIDVSKLGEIQVGTGLIEGWNGNGIGLMMARGAVMGCYLFGSTENKFEKTSLVLGMIFLSFLTVYTGSRTAFIVLVFGFVLYFWMGHPTKLVRNVLITVVIVLVVFFLIMNVESLYNVLGNRFEGLFALFSGEGTVDGSADIRDKFIENGIQWFLENPILGYGVNNYKVLNGGATGRVTYAHNNFIEIAVNLGVVGLAVYYMLFVILGVKLFMSHGKSKLNIYLFAALVTSVVSHYGDVAYYGFYQNFLLLLCFVFAFGSNKGN